MLFVTQPKIVYFSYNPPVVTNNIHKLPGGHSCVTSFFEGEMILLLHRFGAWGHRGSPPPLSSKAAELLKAGLREAEDAANIARLEAESERAEARRLTVELASARLNCLPVLFILIPTKKRLTVELANVRLREVDAIRRTEVLF
ncbi:hypothetical protein T492DRAFT_841042 [Pavlovales sp. CCMP2436]|nr:hypothetical protein T492DRAFT_841042 [Pavlovales sp. CCMP2436]